MNSVVISKDGTIKIPDTILQEFGIHDGDNFQISNEKGTIILKPICRLNNLKGAFPIKGWKEELKNVRDGWSNRTDESSSI
jgi:bifunctional DNA-binding transcriptional regulator/antitoxin component of YhaV-PrlF toxin-antitoxin module